MNTLKNKVSLIGHIGNQPEVQTISGGYKLVRFSLATNERIKNKKGEYVDETQWHTIKAWGSLADIIAKLLTKGSEVIVEGKLKYNNYQTKSGEKRIASEIELKEFEIINKK